MAEQKKPVVYLVMPRGGPMAVYGATVGMAHCSNGAVDVALGESQGASHERNSNGSWYDALNRRDQGEITHYAMIHADVCPEPGWLDKLWAIMQEQNVALVSAVIPFRDFSGLTSTGIDNMADKFCPRRLTMKEVHRLPESFQYKDVLAAGIAKDPNSRLILNTGLMLLDLRL